MGVSLRGSHLAEHVISLPLTTLCPSSLEGSTLSGKLQEPRYWEVWGQAEGMSPLSGSPPSITFTLARHRVKHQPGTSTQETTHRHRESRLLAKVTQHGSTSRRSQNRAYYSQSCARTTSPNSSILGGQLQSPVNTCACLLKPSMRVTM